MKNILKKSQEYAIGLHTSRNQMYHDKPYEFHLWMVFSFAVKYIHLVEPNERLNVLSGAFTHDTIEDCAVTYNDVIKETNLTVAELTYALTNEKGRNRDERANSKYYEGIRNIRYASFLKICDRLANISYSVEVNSSMVKRYFSEDEKFRKELYDEKYIEMFNEMNELFNIYNDNQKNDKLQTFRKS